MMARNALHLGRIWGIEIGLDYSWFVVFALVTWTLSAHYFPLSYPFWSPNTYWLVGLLTSLLFFASVLAHELGHSLVAIRSGIPVRSITLFIFGGVARIVREPTRPLQEFWIALAGPAVSVTLGVLFGAIAVGLPDPQAPLAALAGWLSTINFVLALFNLIPGFPLDGGRVLRAVLWGISGDLLKATRAASWVGRAVAYLFILGGIVLFFMGPQYWLNGIWLAFIGWFLEHAASTSYRQLALRELLSGHVARELLVSDPPWVPRDLTLDRLVDEYILRTGRRCFPVVETDKLLGIVTLHHVKGVPPSARASTKVEAVMTPLEETVKVAPDETLSSLLEQMTADGVNQVLVVQGERLLGLVSREQLLEFIRTRAELGI